MNPINLPFISKCFSIAITLLFTLNLTACGNDADKTKAAIDNTEPGPASAQESKSIVKATSIEKTNAFADFPAVNAQAVYTANNSHIGNLEAPIPPQCYTKTEQVNNPCYVCHQSYSNETKQRLNYRNDASLQGDYNFSEQGISNYWKNLFEDRRDWVAQISDETIQQYVNSDNYSRLKNDLEQAQFKGYIPDLANFHLADKAFDTNGLALDGSHWVAFNYKPFPSTFWPTNGSTGDVLIRMPKAFRERSGEFDKSTYFLNLSLLELSVKELASISIASVDETLFQRDIDGNGKIEGQVETLVPQKTYFSDAENIPVTAQLFPQNTEFLHSVRYIGVDEQGDIHLPKRMKELRYMIKNHAPNEQQIINAYVMERKEKIEGLLPSYMDLKDRGFMNDYGWLISGFIEDQNGHLRPQTYEEKFFCMGCHSSIGSTIDQTFSFARKVTGKEGWGYINLKGMKDSPNKGQSTPEFLDYLSRAGGGDEFRANDEMLERWFNKDGSVNTEKVLNADIHTLITPSAERAHKLNKAYTHIVRHQDYVFGRDATITPPKNVFHQVDPEVAPLKQSAMLKSWESRLAW